MNPLHEAIIRGQKGLAKKIITAGEIDVDERDGTGNTAIIYATGRDYSDIVDMLVARRVDLDTVNSIGSNALHLCATHGGFATATSLVQAGANIEAVNSSISCSRPLHMAAQCGKKEVVEVLLQAGSMVDTLTSRGESAVFLASTSGKADVVSVLLRAKANWQLKCGGLTALAAAVALEHIDVVRAFLGQVGFETCRTGSNYLKYASGIQNIELLSALSDGGATDVAGGALCEAVRFGREGSVELLLHAAREVGADVSRYVETAHDESDISAVASCFDATCLKPRILRRLLNEGLSTEVCTEVQRLGMAFKLANIYRGELKGPMDAVLHLTQQIPAIRGLSWGWPRGVEERTYKPNKFVLRVRVRHLGQNSKVVLAGLFRKKTDELSAGQIV